MTDKNLPLIEKLFYQGFSGGNLDIIDEVFHEDIHFVDPMFPSGVAGIKALVKKNNDAMSDWKFQIDDVVAQGEKTCVRWTARGVHTGSFMGEEPTGNKVEHRGIVIYEIRNDKIVADWLMSDNLGFLSQLGVLNPKDIDMTKKLFANNLLLAALNVSIRIFKT